MTLAEAIQSGAPFKRSKWRAWYRVHDKRWQVLENGFWREINLVISPAAASEEDWITRPLPKNFEMECRWENFNGFPTPVYATDMPVRLPLSLDAYIGLKTRIRIEVIED